MKNNGALVKEFVVDKLRRGSAGCEMLNAQFGQVPFEVTVHEIPL